MDIQPEELSVEHNQIHRMVYNLRIRMFIASFLCCVIGVILMAVTAYYLLMSIFAVMIVLILILAVLTDRHIISSETACLIPMLLLCFIYTPVSWLTFNGLLGCTPYLTLVFSSIVIMTNYRRLHFPLLAAYYAMIAGLIVYWFITSAGSSSLIPSLNTLAAYIISTVLILTFLVAIRKKNIFSGPDAHPAFHPRRADRPL